MTALVHEIYWTGVNSGTPISSVIAWDEQHPLAVTVDFQNTDGSRSPWTFGRELLGEALRRPAAGLGDVKFTRSDRGRIMFVQMDLSSPFGTISLETQCTPLHEFLVQSYLAFPRAQETVTIFDALTCELAEMFPKNAEEL